MPSYSVLTSNDILPFVGKNNYAATVAPTVTDDSAAGYTVGSTWLVPTTGDTWRARSVSAGAASWVKIDAADHPGYVAGRFYALSGQGSPQSGAAPAVGLMYLSYGAVKERITISQLQVRVTTVSAGGNFQLAVYNHNPLTAKASTLIGSTSSGSTATAAAVSVALGANTILEPGTGYWFALQSDNAVAVFLSQGLSSTDYLAAVGSTVGLNATNNTQPAGVSISGQTFGTWPADLSALTQNDLTTARAPLALFLVASVP